MLSPRRLVRLAHEMAVAGVVAIAAIVGLSAVSAQAVPIVIDAQDSGWYDDSGDHTATNQSFVAGLRGVEYRNFFVFDLTPLVGETILTAELRLENPVDGFESPDPSEIFALFHVDTPVPALIAGGQGGPVGQLTFDDLGTGTSYGSVEITTADNGTIVRIPLNAAAISALSGTTGLFAFGGAIATLQNDLLIREFAFGFSDENSTRQLVINPDPIPEPSTALLLGLGLALTGWGARRRCGAILPTPLVASSNLRGRVMHRILDRRRIGAALALVVGVLSVPQAGHALSPTFTYVTMSDGVKIAISVGYPSDFSIDDVDRWGTIFNMNGYGGAGSARTPSAYYQDKYVSVTASIRGTGCSGGRFDLFDRRHANDGYEIIEKWIVRQPWSNGKVGIDGYSYGGLTGWMVASTNPPHLTVITIGGLIDDLYRGIVYPGGVPNNGFPGIWTGVLRPQMETNNNLDRYVDESTSDDPTCAENIATRPPRNPDEDPITRGLSEQLDGPWWEHRALISWITGVRKPIFIAQQYQDEQTGPRGGWILWENLHPDVPKRLVATNGTHGGGFHTAARADRDAWIDCWMMHDGDPDACDTIRSGLRDPSRRVQIYFESTGSIPLAPLESANFPLPETNWTRFYLRADGTAIEAAPGGTEAGRLYLSNPRGRQPGPVNQITSSSGPDELEYVIDFDEPTAIAGPITATLWATVTAPDTDFMITLIDVWPSGEYQYLQRGLLRASHREIDDVLSDRIASGPYAGEIYRPHHPHIDEDLLTLGMPTELRVEIFPVGHVFRADHSLLIKISAPGLTDPISDLWAYPPEDQFASVNTILHDATHPSSILLPLLPALPPIRAIAPGCGAQNGVRCTTPLM